MIRKRILIALSAGLPALIGTVGGGDSGSASSQTTTPAPAPPPPPTPTTVTVTPETAATARRVAATEFAATGGLVGVTVGAGGNCTSEEESHDLRT